MGVVIGTVMGKFSKLAHIYRLTLYTGILFSKFMKFASIKGFIDRESYVAQYLALALFTIGVVSTIGSDDLLAAFAAGTSVL